MIILRKKTKGTQNTGKETLDQEVTDDQVEVSADGDENGGVILSGPHPITMS